MLNAFNDEPHSGLALTSECPPKIAFRLITGFCKSRITLSILSTALFACLIGIRNNFALDHIVVRIEREFYNLKGQNRAPLGSGLQTPFAFSERDRRQFHQRERASQDLKSLSAAVPQHQLPAS